MSKELYDKVIAASKAIDDYYRNKKEVIMAALLLDFSDDEFISIYKYGNYDVWCTPDQATRLQDRAKALGVS